MRNTYLVCYDVCEDKRLRAVHKTMRDFGDHLQYSVFAAPAALDEIDLRDDAERRPLRKDSRRASRA